MFSVDVALHRESDEDSFTSLLGYASSQLLDVIISGHCELTGSICLQCTPVRHHLDVYVSSMITTIRHLCVKDGITHLCVMFIVLCMQMM